MSKSSSRPQASVFGALGPDDAYFSSRVQVAARDAEQRWPLLGGLSPKATEAPPALSSEDRSQWAPRQNAERASSKAGLTRKSLDARLEAGLNRLLRQSDAESAAVNRPEHEPEVAPPTRHQNVPAVPRGPAGRSFLARPEITPPESAPVPPAARAEPQARTPAPRPRPNPAGASQPGKPPEATPNRRAGDRGGKLSDIFHRLAAPAAAPTAKPDAPRPSLLGRLGKR